MDHLALPEYPVAPHPEIDYLCHAEFNLPIGLLLDYPSRRGFDTDDIMLGDFNNIDGWTMEGLIQEWLFFGLLSKILEVPGIIIKHREFVKTGQFNQEVLSTLPLLGYLREWKVREERSLEATRQEHASLIEEILDSARLIVTRLYRAASDYDPLGPAGFAIIAMCETLHHAANNIYGTRIIRRENFWPRSKWPRRRMLSSGWCPNRVQMLHSLLTSSAMYYASALDMKDSREGRHPLCSEYKCGVDHLDRDQYQPKHTVQGCDCDSGGRLGPQPGSLTSALVNGGIPLIRLVERSRNKFEIETVEAIFANSHKYVALSHVWSDGRGNLQANALPICQLQHLQSLVSNISEEDDGPPFFWLDTLCVPITGDCRRIAIGRMRRTYECATKVLVLDSELEVASVETSPVELLMRITCCGWMRRLWTLQEGALAKTLLFQFKEQAVMIGDLASRNIQNNDLQLSNPCAFDSMRCLDHFQQFKTCESNRVLELIEALQWRNTSWKQDEPVCISILLDLDTDKIEATEPEDRMSELLLMMKTFPSHLMFAPGPRIEKKGFHWSPSSVMPPRGFGLPDPQHPSLPGMQSTLGLITSLPGLFLPRSKIPLKQTLWFKIENDHSYYRLTNFGEREDEGPSWSILGPHNIENPALVLGGCFQEGREDDNGALVSIKKKDERILIADFVSRVFISRENGEIPEEVMDRMILAESQKAGNGGVDTAVLTGEARHIVGRTWCIQ